MVQVLCIYDKNCEVLLREIKWVFSRIGVAYQDVA